MSIFEKIAEALPFLRFARPREKPDSIYTVSGDFDAAAFEKRVRSSSRVLNFLWLNLDLPAPPDLPDGSIREPLPLKYVKNIRTAGAAHPETQVVLWVDSQRLTERQLAFLRDSIETDLPNVHLKDLRAIPAYATEDLYNEAETDPHWRNSGQTALIWRQVDAAKIFVSLQGNFDQTFFADLDHAHLDVTAPVVQRMLKKHGLMIGSGAESDVYIENQLWGFERSRRKFFESYYKTALMSAYEGRNAWSDLVGKVDVELRTGENIPLKEICFPIGDDGSRAEQTGHEWRTGKGKAKSPSLIPSGELTRVFNARSRTASAPAQKIKVTILLPPAEQPLPVPPPAAANKGAGCGMH